MLVSQGSIVRARVLDPKGENPKVRPLVIVTATSQVASKATLAAVAITGEFSDPLSDDEVPLPWRSDGHPQTGLTKPCVAKCSWVRRVDPANIKPRKRNRYVPRHELDQIIDKLKKMLANPKK